MNTWFLSMLADHLHGRSSEQHSVSPEKCALANAHQVASVLYYQTRDAQFFSSYLAAIRAYTQRKILLKQITEAFSDIPFFTVKGISVSHYYPVPQLRTMGDCDIVVHPNDKEKAKNALLSAGFVDHTGEYDRAEWHFNKCGLDFELHHSLLYDEAVNTEQERCFADAAWNHVNNHELEVNFHFVYVLIHLKKHLFSQGVGIRQFMDLAAMSQNAALDSEMLCTYLNQCNLMKFAGICSALCQRWFEISFPIEAPTITDDFFNYATETILANGVFGFGVPENREKATLNEVKKHGKIHVALALVFPSYQDCCYNPKYKWIKGKLYLLPILWIYRIVATVFSGKTKSRFQILKHIMKIDKSVDRQNQEMAMWGL